MKISLFDKVKWLSPMFHVNWENKFKLWIAFVLFAIPAVLVWLGVYFVSGYLPNFFFLAIPVGLTLWGLVEVINIAFLWMDKPRVFFSCKKGGKAGGYFPELFHYWWKKYSERPDAPADVVPAVCHKLNSDLRKKGIDWMFASEKAGHPIKVVPRKAKVGSQKGAVKKEVKGGEAKYQSTILPVSEMVPDQSVPWYNRPKVMGTFVALGITVMILILLEKLQGYIVIALAAGMIFGVLYFVYRKSKRKAEGILNVMLAMGILSVLVFSIPKLVPPVAQSYMKNKLYGLFDIHSVGVSYSAVPQQETGTPTATVLPSATLVPTFTPTDVPPKMVPAPVVYSESVKLQLAEQGKSELVVVNNALNEVFTTLNNAASSITSEQNLPMWTQYYQSLKPNLDEALLWSTSGFTNDQGEWVQGSFCTRVRLLEELEALPEGMAETLSHVCQYYVEILNSTEGMLQSLSNTYMYAEQSGFYYETLSTTYSEEIASAFKQAKTYEVLVAQDVAVLNALLAAQGLPEIHVFRSPEGTGYVEYIESAYHNPPKEKVPITATPGPKSADLWPILNPTATVLPSATFTQTPTSVPGPCDPSSVSGIDYNSGRDRYDHGVQNLWLIVGDFMGSENNVGKIVEYNNACNGWVILFDDPMFNRQYWELVSYVPQTNPGTYIKLIPDPAHPLPNRYKFVYSDENGGNYGLFMLDEYPPTPTPNPTPELLNDSRQCQIALAGGTPTYAEDPHFDETKYWKSLIIGSSTSTAVAKYTYCGNNVFVVEEYRRGLANGTDSPYYNWWYSQVIPPGVTESDLWWVKLATTPCDFMADLEGCVVLDIRNP